MSVFTFKEVRDLVLLEGLLLMKPTQLQTEYSTVIFILSFVILFILQILKKGRR